MNENADSFIVTRLPFICIREVFRFFRLMKLLELPLERMGAASFIITPLGYAAESIMPLYNGWCISSHEGVTGYRYIFVGFLVLLAIGFCACLAFRHFTKERRQELAKLRAAK